MAPGRSPPYAADQWESERPPSPSRGRTRSRSVGPHGSTQEARKSPHRKELFPNRRPPSRERQARYRSSRDHSPPHHPRRRDHGSPNVDDEPSSRHKPSAGPSSRNRHLSRSPSPPTSKKRRRRDHSPSPDRISSIKGAARRSGTDKSWHTREYSGDESNRRAGRQKSAANLRDRSPYSTSMRREYEKPRHSEPSRRRSPSPEASHRHSRSNLRTDDYPKKRQLKDEDMAENLPRQPSHRHHRASDRSASPNHRSRAESGRVRERSPAPRRHRSPPPVENFARARNHSPRLGRYSPHRHSRRSGSPYRRDASIERPAGKPRPDGHRYPSQSPKPSAPFHQSRRRSFGSPERQHTRAQSPDHRYAEHPARRTRSRSAHSGRSNHIPSKSRASSPAAYDDHYNRARQHPPHERYDHDSRYPHQPAYHGEHPRGGWNGHGSRG
jgi:hypothetical protein